MRLHGLAVACLFAMGCGSSSSQEGPVTPVEPPPPRQVAPPPAPPPAPVEVSVRVIHAAALAKAAPVNVGYQPQGAPGSLASALVYGTASAYTSATLQPGAQSIPLSVAAEGFDAFADTRPVSAGDPHTTIVFSDASGGTALDAAIAHDSMQAPDSGATKVRFFHAVVGWADLDVCTPGASARDAGTPLFPGSAYGQMSRPEYIDLPAGVQKVQLREASADAPCSGRVLGVGDVAPPEGATLDAQNVTLVATGRGTGRPVVPRGLLLCIDSPAAQPACASQPMRNR